MEDKQKDIKPTSVKDSNIANDVINDVVNCTNQISYCKLPDPETLYPDVGLNDNILTDIMEEIFGKWCKEKPWLK